ncbi:hypothetical protein Tco_0884971, partial [Tanacetum coccineum]
MGEDSAMLTDPQHTPTFIQPSPPPQKTQKPRKPKRKDTQVPQPSGPTELVIGEDVHKELGDSLVRAATTASSLEAEQDSGNITKTRSKATPNEVDSQGTTSGGGPRCQETIGYTIAQTMFENVSKHSNDSLHARGNTLQSDKDRLKLDELMALCTTLQSRVLDLEKTKTTQANEIATRVESFGDEKDLGEDASKQERRINAIDADEDITLVNVQDDADNEIFDVDALTGDEVFPEQEVTAKDVNLTIDEVTLAQALAALKSVKPKVKGDVIKEPNVPVNAASAPTKIKADHELAQRLQAEEQEELSDAEKATLVQQLLGKRRKHFAAKRAEEQRNKPLTQAQQRKIIAFKRVNTFVDFRTYLVVGSSKRAGEELEQESTKKQKVDEDKDIAELQSLMEVIPDEEEVSIDTVPLAIKSPSIVGWKIHKEGKKSYYQIIRVDGKSQMYKIFSYMLKSFSMEDLEDLYKLVKAKYESTRPVEDLDLVLWNDLKNMFEPHVEDTAWRNQQGYKVLEWKLYDSC